MGLSIDREKVIKGLEIHTKPNSRCVGCPYPNNGLCGDQLYMDALTLLKEQDTVTPEFVRNEWRCGACGHVVLTYCFDINEGEMGKVIANYCPSCGRKVKWDDA